MKSSLECRIEHHFPVAVVRLFGVLDLTTASRARAFLYKSLTDQPTALVVDLAELTVPDDVALAVFPTVCRRAADWPGSAVLLCAPRPDVAAALARTAVAKHVPVLDTLADAVAEANARPVPLLVREHYLPSRDAPQQARALVAKVCLAWDVPAVAPPAQVITSELVANAVVHADTPFELSILLRERYLRIAVRDGDRSPVRRGGMVSEDAEGGRGLLVVEALAASWGYVRTVDGKVVWATVRVRPHARIR